MSKPPSGGVMFGLPSVERACAPLPAGSRILPVARGMSRVKCFLFRELRGDSHNSFTFLELYEPCLASPHQTVPDPALPDRGSPDLAPPDRTSAGLAMPSPTRP